MLKPGRRDWVLAIVTIAISIAVFAVVAPFSQVQLKPMWAFIPICQSAIVINDLITAVLLMVQFYIMRARELIVLAAGYLFTGFMDAVHMLTLPGLFSDTGLIGAAPQTTAWLYMLWHTAFH